MPGGNLLIVFAASRALQLGKHQDGDDDDLIFCQFKDGGGGIENESLCIILPTPTSLSCNIV